MKALIIVLICLLAFLMLMLFLSLLPLRLSADLGSEGAMEIKYLFLSFKIKLWEDNKKKKAKKPKKKKAKSGENKKPPQKKAAKKKKSSDGNLKTLLEYSELIKELLRHFGNMLRHIIIERLYINILIAEGDSAKTAISFGAVSAAVYPIVGLLDSITDIKHNEIIITPDFDKSESDGRAELCLKIKPFHIFATLISGIKCFIKFKNSR